MSVLDLTLKKSDGEVPVLLELWGMRSTPSLSSIPGLPWSGVVLPERVLSMGLIELNYIVWNGTVFDIETVFMLNWIVWNRTVWLNWISWNRNVFDN